MDFSEFDINRRGLLRAGAVVGGGVFATSMLTGCGGDDQPSGSNGNGTPKKGGTLSLALSGASEGDQLDGQRAFTIWDIAMSFQLFDSLFSKVRPKGGRATDQLVIVPNLAESASYESDTKLVIKLRKGAEFHDGKPVTADDVLFSMRRIADPKNPAPGAPSLANVDLKSSRAADDLTVELVLTKPDAFLLAALDDNYLRIVPVGFDPKKPIGSGPWKLKNFQPGKSCSFSRFENYFNTPAYADELIFQNYSDDTALVNALTSGAVKLLANVPGSQVKLLEANSRYTVQETETGSSTACFAMRKKTAPFTDKRVREAFRLMIDRQAIVDQVYSGRAKVGNDLFNPFDPAYNADLPQRAHDPEKAKALLTAAGVPSLELRLATGGYAPNIEVVASQAAKAAGVALNVDRIDQSTFYAQSYGQDPIFSTNWPTRELSSVWRLTSLPDSIYNETQEDNADMVRIFAEAQATFDDAKRIDLMKEFQQVQYDEGGYLLPIFVNQIDAHSSDVHGVVADVSGKPFGQYNFKDMWLD